MLRFVLVIGGFALGTFMVLKTEWFLSTFGRIDWAEEKMGTEGGSRIMYKLIGIACIVLSLLSMTGDLQAGILRFFVPLFSGLS